MAYIDNDNYKQIFKGIRSAKMRLFVELHCNPESPTYDNGCQSYLKAYSTDNTNVAAVEAFGLLNKKHVIEAIDRYRAYIHEMNGFQLDWLDNHLRNLFYKVKSPEGSKEELSILKCIGDRIGAFKDAKPDNTGIMVPMTPEENQIANQIMNKIIDHKKKSTIDYPELHKDMVKDLDIEGLN